MHPKLAKLNASVEADEALERMVALINQGFTSGRVTKTQLCSWILREFETSFFKNSTRKIHRAHFDEVSYLESLVDQVKRLKREGGSSSEIAEVIKELGLGGSRKPRKSVISPANK